MSQPIEDLIKINPDLRDEKWETQFLNELPHTNIQIVAPQPQPGPDGWPYLLAKTGSGATEPATKVLQWLSTRGIGLVINPESEYPDYILTYGMVWNFKETGKFIGETSRQDPIAGAAEIKAKKLLAGPPHPQYLPDYVRKVLRDFWRDQGVMRPQILVISEDKKHFDLAFSIESLGSPPEPEHLGIAQAISWFLPPHYSVLLISKKGLPDFIDL